MDTGGLMSQAAKLPEAQQSKAMREISSVELPLVPPPPPPPPPRMQARTPPGIGAAYTAACLLGGHNAARQF